MLTKLFEHPFCNVLDFIPRSPYQFFVQAISGTVNSISAWQLHVYRIGHRHIQSIGPKLNYQITPSRQLRAKFHRNPSCDLRDKTLRADGRTEGKVSKTREKSNVNLKSAIKIRTTARLSSKFQQWYSWFEEWPTGDSTILHRKMKSLCTFCVQ